MSSHTVTAGAAALSECMDARAHNLLQHRLLINSTPECDSLAEYLGRLLHLKVPPSVVAELATLVRRIAESNVAEGRCELAASGLLDDLTRLTRSAELHGIEDALTVKSIARRVREPLALLADPAGADPLALVDAVCTVKDVIDRCPPSQLASTSLRHELRDRAFNLLGRMVAERTETAVAA